MVTAHPDDETFGMGGTIARYIAEGMEVYVVCATKGEAGEAEPALLAQYNSMADLREEEMRQAIQVLGIKEVFFLGYRDSGMAGSTDNENPCAFIRAPLERTGEEIATYIRKLRPTLLLTFDPMGGYGHPDHIHTYRSVMKALEIARDESRNISDLPPFYPQGIYCHTFPKKIMRIVIKLMPLFGKNPRKFGKNSDIDFVQIMDANFPINARIGYRKYSSIREKASACYQSQGGDRQSGYFITWLLRLFNSSEVFMQYYPKSSSRKVKRDLFAELI